MWLPLLWSCTEPAPIPDPLGQHPADDHLSLAHSQVVGTHNSYHVQTTELDAWDYTHPPLDLQIAELGVRQFELDLYWNETEWIVLHLPVIDEGTNCLRFVDCLADLQVGSAAVHRLHVPIVVLLEPKQVHDGELAEDQLAVLDADLAALGSARILPTEIDGPWPVLEGQRGRFVFVWHAGGAWRDTAVALQPESLFFDGYGDLDAERAAIHSINDPTDPRIIDVVAAGHLVRTRADTDGDQARENDPARRDAALASGAHFISTDFPSPHPETGYVVEMPEGAPVRCNDSTSPDDCGALQLEDPALLR